MKQLAKHPVLGRVIHARRLLLALGGLGALALGACDAGDKAAPGAARAAQVSDQPAPTAREIVAQGGTLLDVRTPGEFAGGHLDGAINIPVDALASRIGELPADKPVVVYCRSGRRSAIAADLLAQKGFKVTDIGTMGRY